MCADHLRVVAMIKGDPSAGCVTASLLPGPYCSRALRCRCWCRWSCGPIRRPPRSLGPRRRRRSLRPLRCRWWWSRRRSWLCAGSDQSCLWWCPDHPSHRWSPGNSQSAGCPSLGWRVADLQRHTHLQMNTTRLSLKANKHCYLCF